MPTIKQCTLTNGQQVFYRSRFDVDILTREMSQRPLYLRHGLQLQDGDCIIDVGANIGFFLLQLGRTLRYATVYAFEPVPQIFDVLERNAERHCPLTVQLFNCGLAQSNGTATFTYFPRTSVASTMYPDASAEFQRNSRRFVLSEMRSRSRLLRGLLACTPEWLWFPISESIRRYYQKTEQVTCTLRRLSEVIEEEQIGRIDLLKIDTEGAEEDVLLGIDPHHWDRMRQAVVEVHRGRDGLERVERLLHERGFSTVSESVLPGVEHLYLVYARRD